MTDRHLWATLTLGSHLYGTTVEGSDTDLLELYFPTTVEMVNNKRLSMGQCIKDGIDTRGFLLGDFVMSLGTNPEHMVLAYHYANLFGELRSAWLNARSLYNILDASFNMWDNAKSLKNKAHAWRYLTGAYAMAMGEELYPLESTALREYMWLRTEDDHQLTDEAFQKWHKNARDYVAKRYRDADAYPDRKRLAEWVLLRYLNLA